MLWVHTQDDGNTLPRAGEGEVRLVGLLNSADVARRHCYSAGSSNMCRVCVLLPAKMCGERACSWGSAGPCLRGGGGHRSRLDDPRMEEAPEAGWNRRLKPDRRL